MQIAPWEVSEGGQAPLVHVIELWGRGEDLSRKGGGGEVGPA